MRAKTLRSSCEAAPLPAVEYWVGKILLDSDRISSLSYERVHHDLSGTQFLAALQKDMDELKKRVAQQFLHTLSEADTSFSATSSEEQELPEIHLSQEDFEEYQKLFGSASCEDMLDNLLMYRHSGKSKLVLAAAFRKLVKVFDVLYFWNDVTIDSRFRMILEILGREEQTSYPHLSKWFTRLEKQISEDGLFSGTFGENMDFLGRCYDLSREEKDILGLLVLFKAEPTLCNALNYFDFSSRRIKLVMEMLSFLLSISLEKVGAIFREKKSLAFVKILEENERCGQEDFEDYFEFNFPCTVECFLTTKLSFEWFVSKLMKKEEPSSLSFDNYDYLPEIREVVLPYLKSVRKSSVKGVNILLYGPSGTGKTQLSKLLALASGFDLYSPLDNGFAEKSSKRFEFWKQANMFLKNEPSAAILIDEGDDFFNADVTESGRSNKYFINSELENNPRPTIWTSNSLNNMDSSMIRRFNLIVKVSNPPKNYLRDLAEEKFRGFLSEKNISLIAETQNLSPAVISQTAAIASKIASKGANISEKYLMKLISDILQAQGFNKIANKSESDHFYDHRLTNSGADLKAILEGLRQNGSGRLCLYGPSGTGKTAFGKWAAKELGKPLILKKASDLLSCYVGETEQLIAEAFEEAEREGAVLLIDEADSFLNTRSLAQHSWEVTRVNEFLTQMENFEGIFIATTNLMDILDEACMRRFDLKAKFDFVTPDQAANLLRLYAKKLSLELSEENFESLSKLDFLTPGDFSAACGRMKFVKTRDGKTFLRALEEQVKAKPLVKTRTIGFAA